MAVLVSLILPGLLIVAALHDISSFKIPNRIILALLAVWPVAHFFMGGTIDQALMALLSAGLLFAIGFGLFAKNLLGAGDVKLFATTMLWLGGEHIIPFVMATTIFGAVFAIVLVGFRRMPIPAANFAPDWLLRLHMEQKFMPYGVAIAFGGLMIWPNTIYWSF